MPTIFPPGGEVDWPANERVLGVVGVAPWATLDFLEAFYSEISVRKDWEYPRVLIDINTKIPSRGRHLALGETDPSPDISATISELERGGASVIVVACNTAHLMFEAWSAGHSAAILNIVDETSRLLSLNESHQKVVALTSRALQEDGLYSRMIIDSECEPLSLDNSQTKKVSDAIESVKLKGAMSEDVAKSMYGLALELAEAGADTVILGCTELSGAASQMLRGGLLVVDSNLSLARAAHAALYP
jgi:aspartate racemase